MSTHKKTLKDDIDTYVSQIKHSKLFSIVVEGKDDLLVYKEFETIYKDLNPIVDVFPVGGRNTVLGIFNQLKNTPYINRTIFIVDQDQWILTSRDPNYIHPNIICTSGYSFENDIFMDGQLDQELVQRRLNEHNQHLPTLLNWYALEVDRIRNGRATYYLDMSPQYLFDPTYTTALTTPLSGEILDQQILHELQQNYPLLLRGKTLLKYYVYLLDMRLGLKGAHSTRAVISSVADNKGTNLNRIFSDVDQIYRNLTS